MAGGFVQRMKSSENLDLICRPHIPVAGLAPRWPLHSYVEEIEEVKPGFVASGSRYQGCGQSMDEVFSGSEGKEVPMVTSDEAKSRLTIALSPALNKEALDRTQACIILLRKRGCCSITTLGSFWDWSSVVAAIAIIGAKLLEKEKIFFIREREMVEVRDCSRWGLILRD
ncbi:hypothetical protein RHSIM_Rhsim05G0076400 [Rhododendron simsii]|uniref:Uncharacterized protein n=1 Tax=Rhododendron simsii TaxID=118357 RepID=A0A834LLQ2_RHOSS|nr:hypothetical protein RHSIM_Rhsim05G0076400 [Rhododendron simsii]